MSEIESADAPLAVIFCEYCSQMVKPSYQVRMSPDECGQPTDCVLWDCSRCKRGQVLADDLSILSADILEII